MDTIYKNVFDSNKSGSMVDGDVIGQGDGGGLIGFFWRMNF